MTSIGETLRRERLKRNLELEEISRELKISSRLLEAIEEEKFEKLPGGVFTKSFVRQYARALGLDDEEIAGEVERVLEPQPEMPRFGEPVRQADSGIHVPRVPAWKATGQSTFSWTSPLPALAGMVVVMLVCSLVYAWWQRARHPVMARENIASAAQSTQAPQPAPPAMNPPAAAPAATAAPAGDQSSAGQPAASSPAAPETPAPQPAAREAAAPVAAGTPPGPEPVVSQSDPHAPGRVELPAEETVWVLARTDGKYLFSGTMEAKEIRTVAANNNVVLRLGNAGGVSIVLNGKPIGAVGPRGQVRTVQLTSGGFKIVSANPVPLDPL